MSIITDKDLIRKAICAPKSMPDSFIPKTLEPVGTSRFKGEKILTNWSVNSKFEKGFEYPVYFWEDDVFVIGNDNVGYKMTPTAWSETKIYS